MANGSLTIVKDEEGKVLVLMDRRSGGGPDVHGEELASFLRSNPIGNGSMNWLAAEIVYRFRLLLGEYSIILRPPDGHDLCADNVYVVYSHEGKVKLRCEDYFDGVPSDFAKGWTHVDDRRESVVKRAAT